MTRCVEIGIDILIDDAPSNLVSAAEKGIHGATLWHPWNAETCERSDITCAQDWIGLRSALSPRLGT